jgi:hypothetical protein
MNLKGSEKKIWRRRNVGTEGKPRKRNVLGLSGPPRQWTARTKLRWSSAVHLILGTVDLVYRLTNPFLKHAGFAMDLSLASSNPR